MEKKQLINQANPDYDLNRKPEFQIEIIFLSAKKLFDNQEGKSLKIEDVQADVVMRKLVLGDMATTEQKVGNEFKIVKISKFNFEKEIFLKDDKSGIYLNLTKSNIPHLSLVEYPTLFLQFYRFFSNHQFYWAPKKDYFSDDKEYRLEQNRVYSEQELLKTLTVLTKKFIKPQTIIQCKP